MSARAHILIGFTPYHMMAIAAIAKGLTGAVYVFHPARELLCAEFNLPPQVTFLGRGPGRYLRYASAALAVRKILRERGALSVYAPHPDNNPLSNYLLLRTPEGVEKNIYEDGILNYYDAKIPTLSRWKRVRRFFRSLAVGLPYTRFTGHLSGVESFCASGGYFSHPERVVLPDRFRELHKLDSAAPRNVLSRIEGAVTLFLDQPIEKILPAARAADLRRAAESLANNLGLPVVYKAHHDQGQIDSMQKGWTLISPDLQGLPAEVLASSSGIVNVVGFFSSALANISNQNPGVQCFAVGADQVAITVGNKPATIGDLLAIFGVALRNVSSVGVTHG